MNSKIKQQYFDKLGEYFDEYMSDYDVQQRKSLIFHHLLKNKVLKEKHILEVGCGTGRFSMEILKRGGSLTVIDIGQNLVRKVSETLTCSGSVGDACRLPFSDNTFDFIISSECIEHTVDPKKAIQEMCRVCCPEGYVCITSPNRLWYPLLLVAQWTGARKFSGIENWIYPHQAIKICKNMNMTDVHAGGCHILPFQLKILRPLLYRIDMFGKWLFPLMINFGIIARKNY